MDHDDRDLLAEAITARVVAALEPRFAPLQDNPVRIKALEKAHEEAKKDRAELRRGILLTAFGCVLTIACTVGAAMIFHVH